MPIDGNYRRQSFVDSLLQCVWRIDDLLLGIEFELDRLVIVVYDLVDPVFNAVSVLNFDNAIDGCPGPAWKISVSWFARVAAVLLPTFNDAPC